MDWVVRWASARVCFGAVNGLDVVLLQVQLELPKFYGAVKCPW